MTTTHFLSEASADQPVRCLEADHAHIVILEPAHVVADPPPDGQPQLQNFRTVDFCGHGFIVRHAPILQISVGKYKVAIAKKVLRSLPCRRVAVPTRSRAKRHIPRAERGPNGDTAPLLQENEATRPAAAGLKRKTPGTLRSRGGEYKSDAVR